MIFQNMCKLVKGEGGGGDYSRKSLNIIYIYNII